MTKNKDRNPDGYFEVIQDIYFSGQHTFKYRTTKTLNEAMQATAALTSIQTVAIGRIYLKKNNP